MIQIFVLNQQQNVGIVKFKSVWLAIMIKNSNYFLSIGQHFGSPFLLFLPTNEMHFPHNWMICSNFDDNRFFFALYSFFLWMIRSLLFIQYSFNRTAKISFKKISLKKNTQIIHSKNLFIKKKAKIIHSKNLFIQKNLREAIV